MPEEEIKGLMRDFVTALKAGEVMVAAESAPLARLDIPRQIW